MRKSSSPEEKKPRFYGRKVKGKGYKRKKKPNEDKPVAVTTSAESSKRTSPEPSTSHQPPKTPSPTKKKETPQAAAQVPDVARVPPEGAESDEKRKLKYAKKRQAKKDKKLKAKPQAEPEKKETAKECQSDKPKEVKTEKKPAPKSSLPSISAIFSSLSRPQNFNFQDLVSLCNEQIPDNKKLLASQLADQINKHMSAAKKDLDILETAQKNRMQQEAAESGRAKPKEEPIPSTSKSTGTPKTPESAPAKAPEDPRPRGHTRRSPRSKSYLRRQNQSEKEEAEKANQKSIAEILEEGIASIDVDLPRREWKKDHHEKEPRPTRHQHRFGPAQQRPIPPIVPLVAELAAAAESQQLGEAEVRKIYKFHNINIKRFLPKRPDEEVSEMRKSFRVGGRRLPATPHARKAARAQNLSRRDTKEPVASTSGIYTAQWRGPRPPSPPSSSSRDSSPNRSEEDDDNPDIGWVYGSELPTAVVDGLIENDTFLSEIVNMCCKAARNEYYRSMRQIERYMLLKYYQHLISFEWPIFEFFNHFERHVITPMFFDLIKYSITNRQPHVMLQDAQEIMYEDMNVWSCGIEDNDLVRERKSLKRYIFYTHQTMRSEPNGQVRRYGYHDRVYLNDDENEA